MKFKPLNSFKNPPSRRHGLVAPMQIMPSDILSVALPQDGPLDLIPNATAAYGVSRRLSKNYAGPLVQAWKTGGATADIYAAADGSLDVNALETFAAGGNAFAQTIYDQSGNGNDLTQTIAARMPQIVSSGTVILGDAGEPVARFDGSDDGYGIDFGLPNTAPADYWYMLFTQRSHTDPGYVVAETDHSYPRVRQKFPAPRIVLNGFSEFSTSDFPVADPVLIELKLNRHLSKTRQSQHIAGHVEFLMSSSVGALSFGAGDGAALFPAEFDLHEFICYVDDSHTISQEQSVFHNINTHYKLWRTTLQTGLVACWPLNQPGGASVSHIDLVSERSASGDAAQATSGNVPNLGHSLVFAGTDGEQLSVPYAAELAPARQTVACWVWLDASPGVGEVINLAGMIDDDTFADGNYSLSLRDNGFAFSLIDSTGTERSAAHTTTLATGQWHFLVGSYDGAQIKVFLNGVEQASTSFSGDLSAASSYGFTIGGYEDGALPILQGRMQQVMLYNRALTQAEIDEHHTHGRGLHFASFQKPTDGFSHILGDQLHTHWPLSEKDGSRYADHGDVDFTNSNFSVDAPGVSDHLGQSAAFVSASNDKLEASTSAEATFTGPFTIAFWLRPSALAANTDFIDKSDSSTLLPEYRVRYSGSNLRFEVANTSGTTYWAVGPALTLDQWHFVVCVCDPASNRIRISVDAAPFASQGFSGTAFTGGDGKLTLGEGSDCRMQHLSLHETAWDMRHVVLAWNSGKGLPIENW